MFLVALHSVPSLRLFDFSSILLARPLLLSPENNGRELREARTTKNIRNLRERRVCPTAQGISFYLKWPFVTFHFVASFRLFYVFSSLPCLPFCYAPPQDRKQNGRQWRKVRNAKKRKQKCHEKRVCPTAQGNSVFFFVNKNLQGQGVEGFAVCRSEYVCQGLNLYGTVRPERVRRCKALFTFPRTHSFPRRDFYP